MFVPYTFSVPTLLRTDSFLLRPLMVSDEMFLWVRKSEFERRMDAVLFDCVKQWMKSLWPFQKVAFPFRNA